MTAKELALSLNGREYDNYITPEECKKAKESGLVVVFGYAEDRLEFYGYIEQDIDCEDGGSVYFNGQMEFIYEYPSKQSNKISVSWNDNEIAWDYKTDIPHEVFAILDTGTIFCRGIVFSISDLKP